MMRRVLFLLGLPVILLVFLLSLQLFFQAFPEIWAAIPGLSRMNPGAFGSEESHFAKYFTIRMSANPKVAALILAGSACACGSYLVQALEVVRLERKSDKEKKD